MTPEQAKKHGYLCPTCGKKLVIGVWDRIEELADRPKGYTPKKHVPFKSLLPLSEIISNIMGKGINTKNVWAEYQNLVTGTRSEFEIMLETPLKELKKLTTEKIAKSIIDNRKGKINIIPGYDGVYGEPLLNGEKVIPLDLPEPKVQQKNLADF